MFSVEEGKFLIKIARRAVETGNVDKKYPEKFREKKGVFVTLSEYPSGKLRGCIGFPYPEYELGEGVQRAAIAAAFEDPRFNPVRKEELGSITFEVSILSEPKETSLENIEEGRDGVILISDRSSALFLPQVWEFFESKEEFLSNLCLKAGEPPDCYEKARFMKFGATVFSEKKPNGDVVRITYETSSSS